ncbi:hypothetical protein L9F63_017883 [Diploptera punctata]|uniref:Uncharacterized protein n=1 Tax=Diploptera punctata TaxID=6984 RepID=A0AAD7ZXN5_DIPPU|nr:hypothetical protein L9F63_017883 [Diploptera punctata]
MKAIVCLAVVALFSAVCAQRDYSYNHARELATAALLVVTRGSTCECRYEVYKAANLVSDEDYSNFQFDMIVRTEELVENQNATVTYQSCPVSAVIGDTSESISVSSCSTITEEEAGEGDTQGGGGNGNGDGGDGNGDGGDGTTEDGGADGGDEGGQ